MRPSQPAKWPIRALSVVIVLALGILTAIPFRRPAPSAPGPIRTIRSDSVRLVFRNQDITLQPSLVDVPSPANYEELNNASQEAGESEESTVQESQLPLPMLDAEYHSLLMPSTATSPNSKEVVGGRVLESPESRRPTFREHVLVDGDTLERLAERYLGHADFSEQIYLLNRDVLPDKETLPLGKVIRIPPRIFTHTGS